MPTERRRTSSNPLERDKLRRRATVQAILDNEETLYFVNATIGTPPQSVRLHLDTGSSDLWLNTPGSRLCQLKSTPCAYAGAYAGNASSTYQYIGSHFNISYVDGSGASGDYVSDTVAIGTTTLDRLQFGIGYASTSAQGILGIGYELNEVQVNRAGRPPYRNLPSQMVADGLTRVNAYSLWLNDLDANLGSILFGGIDTEHYVGGLHTLPVQPEAGVHAELMVTLTALDMGATRLRDTMALAVLLDSGSSLTYLPDDLVQLLYDRVGAVYDAAQGAAYVPCALYHQPTNLTFAFSGPRITVGMDELVLDLVTASGGRPTFQDGRPACLFGVAPAGAGTNVLGDTFLRSAYVVFDLDNNEVSIAQTRFNTTRSNVREIVPGAGVPDATKVANPVAATAGLHFPSKELGKNAAGRLGERAGVAAGFAAAAAVGMLVGGALVVG